MGKPVISELINLLEQYGVSHAVCSPGSRNAVLLYALEAHCGIIKHVVTDERTAAFFALGIATVSKKPVALVCTSGTALLNYSPAIAEAYYQGIPLIAVTADRPMEWIDQDDSQTIRQPGALSHFVKASYDLNGDDKSKNYLWYCNRIINEGLSKALCPKQGPVHFNVHLDGKISSDYLFAPLERAFDRKIETIRSPKRLDSRIMHELANSAKDKKIMVTAGFMQPDNRLQRAISLFSSLPNVCIMAETVSNLHLPPYCYAVDTVLFPLLNRKYIYIKEFEPDIVISIGGALISRKLKEFLRHVGAEHWSLSDSDTFIDCFQSLIKKIEADIPSFFLTLAKLIKRMQKEKMASRVVDYKEKWINFKEETRKHTDNIPWSDLKALDIVLNRLPYETNLFLSNGTSVRYGQILPYPLTHAVYSNRGVSGIEGSTSTAIGGSIVYEGFTCLISGDMSFGYDMGAISCNMADNRFRAIVIDNGGGEIFRFIDATKELPIREKYLCVGQKHPLMMLAAAFEWNYFYANDVETLRSELEEFFSPSLRPCLLHIDTTTCYDNAAILRNFLTK